MKTNSSSGDSSNDSDKEAEVEAEETEDVIFECIGCSGWKNFEK